MRENTIFRPGPDRVLDFELLAMPTLRLSCVDNVTCTGTHTNDEGFEKRTRPCSSRGKFHLSVGFVNTLVKISDRFTVPYKAHLIECASASDHEGFPYFDYSALIAGGHSCSQYLPGQLPALTFRNSDAKISHH